MKILRTIDAELKESCPRIVYIKQLSKQAGASSNLTTCLSNLVKFEVEIYFVCQHSFTVVKETRITIKVTRQWVKYCGRSIIRSTVSLLLSLPIKKDY